MSDTHLGRAHKITELQQLREENERLKKDNPFMTAAPQLIDHLEAQVADLQSRLSAAEELAEARQLIIDDLNRSLSAAEEALKVEEDQFEHLLADWHRAEAELEKHGTGKCMEFDRVYPKGIIIPDNEEGK